MLLQSLTLTTLFAVVVVALGLLGSEPLFLLIGLSDAVVNQAAGYMRIQFVAMAVMSYQRMSAPGFWR